MTDESPPDEDTINAAATNASSEGGPIEGFEKHGGGGNRPYYDAQQFAALEDELFQFHLRVMRGQKFKVRGPTNKTYWADPTLFEMQQSALWLDKYREKRAGPITTASVTDTASEQEVRAALASFIQGQMPLTAPLEQIDSRQRDDSEVLSISDPTMIAEHDRGVRNSGKSKAKPRVDENNPKPGDRLELWCGFYAIWNSDHYGSRKYSWYCFNDADDHCANKANAAAVKDWFWSNTGIGQAEEKRIGGRENATEPIVTRAPQAPDGVPFQN